ncbi:MAG: DUF885 domain-containing protein, partial [Maribacter dokdonensis]
MKKIIIAFALITGLYTQAQLKTNGEVSTNPTVHNVGFITLLAHYYDDGLKLNPLNATFQGDNRYNDTLPNFLSDSFKKELVNYYQTYLERAEKFED